jgi:hypothetical protein
MDPERTNLYLARYGVWVVLAGLGVILAAFTISVFVFEPTAADVSTALAPVTGIVGTIVGAYFGVQVGSQGRQQAEATTARAQEQVTRLAAAADPARVAEILRSDEPREGME